MTAALLPNGQQQFFDLSGEPLAGGQVFAYVPFTTTPMTTWVDQAQTTPNTNPITLDPLGRATIWGVGTYRQVVLDAAGNLIWDALTSDGGLAGLQSQIDTLMTTVTALQSQVTALSGQVNIIGATGLQYDIIYSSGPYVIKASDLYVMVIGGGGGGAGTNAGGTPNPAGGGAGGAAYQSLTNLQVGSTLTVSIGAGGPGGGTSNSSGGAGSTSSLSSGTQAISTVSASGGQPGTFPATGGVGGIGSGGNPNIMGNGGSPATGGVLYPYSPYGDGGSVNLNGVSVSGSPLAGQAGASGLVMIMGVW